MAAHPTVAAVLRQLLALPSPPPSRRQSISGARTRHGRRILASITTFDRAADDEHESLRPFHVTTGTTPINTCSCSFHLYTHSLPMVIG
jgi:hypothetical protein